MANEMQKEVLFNDGESLEPVDLNNIQRFLHARINDGIFDAMSGHLAIQNQGTYRDVAAAGGVAEQVLSVGIAGACYSDGTDLEVRLVEGPILIPTTSGTFGDAPRTLMYYLQEADVPDQVRPVASANPRWDLLTVKMSETDGQAETRNFKDGSTGALSSTSLNKRKTVVPTFTWTQGTESATPVVPAPPGATDYVICAVKVPTSSAPLDGRTDMRDYRIPLGMNVTKTELSNIIQIAGAGTSAIATGATGYNLGLTLTGTQNITLLTPFPGGSFNRRVRRIIADTSLGSNLTYDLKLYYRDGGTLTQVPDTAGTGPWEKLASSTPFLSMIEDLGTASDRIPIWGNGFPAGYAAHWEEINVNRVSNLELHMSWDSTASTTAVIDAILWEYWGL